MHPTSLPGPYGIGDVGPTAHRFIDWLSDAGLAYWQVLPLGPTGYGDSPYQCFSAFAGNPLLISPDVLVREGLLNEGEMHTPDFPSGKVDYGWVIPWKQGLLQKAHERFVNGHYAQLRQRYEAFMAREDVQFWLEDFSLFMAAKDSHGGQSWDNWEEELRAFKPAAVKKVRKELAPSIDYHRFNQFLFFDQWEDVKKACHKRGIQILGDAPIYVAYDSADTWAHQDLFRLDKNGKPTHVAGVPPDYFSATGQLWGNPLYKWEQMKKDGYAWWVARMKSLLAQVDMVRLDHFRGFMGYYAIPFGSPTAETGRWEKGPGVEFLQTIKDKLHGLPIIAEDLGEITRDVTEARLALGLPGMKVLQFAWTVVSTTPLIPDYGSGFLPHQMEPNLVIYTGTHDNDTSLGWWHHTSTPEEHTCMQVYLSTDGNCANWDLIRAAFMSVANTAIVPAQDVLDLGTEARMNFPGRGEGNWSWRLHGGQLNAQMAEKVRNFTLLYERCNNPPEAAIPPKQKEPPY